MLVMGHTIDEQWDLIQQFEGFVEHALTDVVETWLGAHQVPSALTAAAGDDLLDGEGSFSALWNSQVQGVFTTYLTNVYDASSLALAHDALSQADLAAGLGVAGVPDDFSADFVHQTANKMVGVSDQVWQNIRTELAKGVAANEDIEQLADRVRTAASVSMPRALTVARTTVIAASNAGSYAQASLLAGEGGMKKRWVATEDNRVRPDHHNADGQTVAMNSPFMVGGWAMMYPGDPAGPADEVINCRCTITYEFDDITSVCECGSEPALTAAGKPKISVPMGASCICPAIASLTPAGYQTPFEESKLGAHLAHLGVGPEVVKADIYDVFQEGGKVTPSVGGAKIHKRLQTVMKYYAADIKDTERFLDIIDEQYALAGGKTSFKAKYEEWLQTNAGKKAVPQAVTPVPAAVIPVQTAYVAGWDGLITSEQSDFAHLWKAFKQDVKTGATPQEAFEIIVSDISDNPSAWGSLIQNLSVEDLKGYMKVAGQKLGDDVTSLDFGTVMPAPSVIIPAAPAAIDYADLWSQLTVPEKSNFMKAYQVAKSYHDTGAPLEDVLRSVEADFKTYPSDWMSVVKNSGTDDLKGLMKIAGDALSEDTSWLEVSGGPTPLATAIKSPAVANAKTLLTSSQLDTLASELKYQVSAGHATLDDAFTSTLSVLQKTLPKPTADLIEGLTNDEIFALVKDYQTAVGQSTDWIGNTISKYAAGPIAPAAPVVTVPATALDINDLAKSAGFAGQGDLASMFYELKSAHSMGIGDYPAVLHYFRTVKAKAALSKKGFEALGQLTDDEITSLVKQYGDSLHKDTSWLPAPAATAPAPAGTAADLLDQLLSNIPSATPVSTAVDLLDISGVAPADAQKLYDFYKVTKPVTPSWGGAAIYKNLQTVRGLLKSHFGTKFDGLNDGQLLKLLDQVWYQNAKAGSKSYYDEVTSWLKTPGGKKYLKDNGIMPPPEPGGVTPAATKAPSVPPATPAVAPVVPAAPTATPAKAVKTAKKAPKPKAAPKILDTEKFLSAVPEAQLDSLADNLQTLYVGNGGDLTYALQAIKSLGQLPADWTASGLTDDQVTILLKLHATKAGKTTTFPMPTGVKMKKLPTPAVQFTSAAGDISGIEPGVKQIIFDKIKAQSVYLSSTGQKIWDTLGPIEASLKGKYTKLQLVRILDEMSAAKFGTTNASLYEQKLVKWLKTSAGKQHAGGIVVPKAPGIPTPKGVLFDPGPVDRSRLVTTTEKYDIIDERTAQQLQDAQVPWTAPQKAGLVKYTGASYDDMNAALRAGRQIPDSLERSIRAAQQGMRPSTRPMLLHRGTDAKQFVNLGLNRNSTFAEIKALEGMEVVDEGFFSSSVGGSAAFGGKPVLIELEAPTGTPMAYVANISAVGSHEREMLLAAGTRFKILSVTQGTGGYYSPTVVRMRVIP